MLLEHWRRRKTIKYYLFGIGTDFLKLKYPFIWYDILHVTDVLSRPPFARKEKPLQQMVAVVRKQSGVDGQYTAGSMFQSWKGWSFADKKQSSPWLTFLVLRLLKRMERMD